MFHLSSEPHSAPTRQGKGAIHEDTLRPNVLDSFPMALAPQHPFPSELLFAF